MGLENYTNFSNHLIVAWFPFFVVVVVCRWDIFDVDVKQNGLILTCGRVMLGVPVEVCNMLIDSSLVFHRSYNEKWIFYNIKCSLLCCGTIKSLEASFRHCADSVRTSVWRLIEFH